MHRSLLVLLVFLAIPAMAFDYPDSRRESTTNTYHEVVVDDPYQWLEDWSSEEVKTWLLSLHHYALTPANFVYSPTEWTRQFCDLSMASTARGDERERDSGIRSDYYPQRCQT